MRFADRAAMLWARPDYEGMSAAGSDESAVFTYEFGQDFVDYQYSRPLAYFGLKELLGENQWQTSRR